MSSHSSAVGSWVLRGALCRVAWLLLLGPTGGTAQEDARAVYSEVVPGVGVSVELGGGPSFVEDIVFSLYFLSEDGPLEAAIVMPDDQVVNRSVFEVREGDATARVLVERCQVKMASEQCVPVDPPAEIELLGESEVPGRGLLVEVVVPPQAISGPASLRLTMEQGRYTLAADTSASSEQARASPGIDRAILPALSSLEKQYLEQRPFLHFDATPLVRAEESGGVGGFDDLGLSFEGGIYRVLGQGNSRVQLTWDGEVATSDSAAFNHVTVDAGLARNLVPSDWLPLTLSARAQTDQAFDLLDLSANARLAFLLPFNLNFQSGRYRPAVPPLLEVLAAYGSAVVRPDDVGEDAFFRAGYEVTWRVPLGVGSLLNLRHAGMWNDPADVDGEWHQLWDVRIEIAVAGVTYFVGYQDGEAAPLFSPLEATQIGFSFAIDRGPDPPS